MHRVSVFRDDFIFVLYMIQRRIYPVDASRPAEGFDDEPASSKEAAVAGEEVREEVEGEEEEEEEGGESKKAK